MGLPPKRKCDPHSECAVVTWACPQNKVVQIASMKLSDGPAQKNESVIKIANVQLCLPLMRKGCRDADSKHAIVRWACPENENAVQIASLQLSDGPAPKKDNTKKRKTIHM